MLRKKLYPKTERVKLERSVIVTEKLDGSNLGFFKLNGKLYIATRSHIIALEEIGECKSVVKYRGLYGFLEKNGADLEARMNEGSCFFCEWMGMGKLPYGKHFITEKTRAYMFAKANVTDDFTTVGLKYDPALFIYPFVDQVIPDYIGVVPVVAECNELLSIAELDDLYDIYTGAVERPVEGFVVNTEGSIRKYVRFKNGKFGDHFE